MSKPVNVKVTDKRAIYVNDTRITDRGTKYGVHTIIDEFECERDEVERLCLERGHADAVSRINDPTIAAAGA